MPQPSPVAHHLRLQGICQSYGSTPVLDDLHLDVAAGEYCVVLGPSGCGKSTLLRIIAGLQTGYAGEISLAGRSLRRVAPKNRDLAILFQDDRLYPHWTLRQNLQVAARNSPLAKTNAIISEPWLQRLGIADLLDRRPDQISGGQLRRAALAKALLRQASVCLLDEPLSAIDAVLREDLLNVLADFPRERGDALPRTAIVHVTHDGEEAMRLADRVVVMGNGQVLQAGTPEQVYCQPKTIAVARAIGTPPVNLIPFDWVRTAAGSCAEELQNTMPQCDDSATLVVRPEAIRLVTRTPRDEHPMRTDRDQWLIAGKVISSRFVSGRWFVRFVTDATPSRTLSVSTSSDVTTCDHDVDACITLSEIACVFEIQRHA